MLLKLIIALFVPIGSLVAATVERPKNIPSKLTEIQARDWYEEKVRSWQSYLAEKPEDRMGWLEYFKAMQYAGATAQELSAVAGEISLKFENTHEAHYARSQMLGWSDEGIEELSLAIQKAPDTEKLLSERILMAEVLGDRPQRKKLLEELSDRKVIYPSLLNYSYNELMSVGDKGILVVQGETATVPVWLLQDVLKVRQDVRVLDIDLAKNPDYLTHWMMENQLNGKEKVTSTAYREFISRLPGLNPDDNFFYALTLPNDQVNGMEERLYVVGLTSLHSEKVFDHYKMLKENIETRFLIDYLTLDLNGEPKTATGKVYEANYILPFFLLKEYYDNTGNAEYAQKWQDMILTLADRSQIKNRVTMLLDSRSDKKNVRFKPVKLDIKELDRSMMRIKGNLYASQMELTNKEYWFFLDYLRQNGYTELYEKSKADLSKYDEFTGTFLSGYHYSPVNAQAARVSKSKMDDVWRYPAIDMTFEAAKAYCQWLTFQYNQQADRAYKRVRFRLPTQKEWTMAALGYKEFTSWNLRENIVNVYPGADGKKKSRALRDLADFTVSYPWGMRDFELRNSIINHKDCYLANIKAPEEILCPIGIKGDGWSLMSPTGTYFPNELGLFDVIGNVGEMIDEDGKAMGGSWNHVPDESTITSVNTYEGSDITVGFRPFMEVIEE
ncbi:SUMF1/EgtB/PvdOfamily nonheme iron enzyme [Fulvivirga sp. M361]|uniref:formylglycine-generating enzyme family protein n=1 Tax=Fulvivirga sp. M361 TaxID=2594266 RepID=UPI00117A669C|nr:SUMF1/EgtB/PvdO family nonheme iron enzyme [Fulvivirga sp. M361]TRX59030.1 SUMF1/EgtB/PvdOfamily nonheme iron enzyme [Fulvivirga sp. M361]